MESSKSNSRSVLERKAQDLESLPDEGEEEPCRHRSLQQAMESHPSSAAAAHNHSRAEQPQDDIDDKNNKDDNDNNNPSAVKYRFGLLLLFLLLFPILPLTISVVMGGFLAWVEGVKFEKGFLYVASNLLSMSNPLTDYNPQDPVGITIDVYVSVVALLCFGIVINVVHLFYLPTWMNQRLAACMPRRRTQRILIPLIAVGFVIPFLFVVVSVFFGILLGLAEGWSLKDGILYVLSNLLSLGTPLTDVLPTTMGGDLLDIFISSMALGCVAVFVDYVTSLNPARYIRKRTKDWMMRRGIVDRTNRLSIDAPGLFDDFDDDFEEDEEDNEEQQDRRNNGEHPSEFASL